MSTRVAHRLGIAAVALLGALLAAGPALAEGHGGGGGHAGAAHGFGGRGFGGHAGAVHGFAAGPRFGGGAYRAPAYAGRTYGGYRGYAAPRVGNYAHVGVARPGFGVGYGYGHGYVAGSYAGRGFEGHVWGRGWHPGYGYHWGGGYWGGRYWPPIFIGTGFAWFLPVVPAWCPVYWWGDVPYYYYDDVYYTWDNADAGYVATAPPPALGEENPNASAPIDAGAPYDAAAADAADAAAADAAGAAAPTDAPTQPPAVQAAPDSSGAIPPPSSGNLYAYPKNGQSEQQQAQDQRACERWAATHAAGSGSAGDTDSSIDYRRALAACLTGRGYSVD